MRNKWEIERKFLVKELPKNLLDKAIKQKIWQGYLQVEPDEIRIRKKGVRFYLTKKSSGDLERSEVEIEISEKVFIILWPITEGKRIEKTRYVVPYGKLQIELDIYFNGKMIAEIELPNKNYDFKTPAWFCKEVTYDNRYKNKNLSVYGFPSD